MNLTRDPLHVPHYGVFEFALEAKTTGQHPIFETDYSVIFTRPDGTAVTAEGFYDGGRTYKARAYANALGEWQWRTQSNVPELNDRSGSFAVEPSTLKGQLKHHPDDP